MKPIIVSFGGGVQSTAMALMVLQGKLPRPDLWLFADTGDEPEAVYPHVKKWRKRIEAAGMPFEVLHRFEDKKALSDHVIERLEDTGSGVFTPPFWLDCEIPERQGEKMPMRRKCTFEYKVKPLDKRSKEFAKVPRGYKGEPLITKWLGISYDEIQRARISREPWFAFEYPLIDRRIRRGDCLKMLADAGETAPRSACVYCPFHSDEEWRRVKKNPKDWDKAVAFEKRIHELHAEDRCMSMRGRPTLHRSGVALDEIDFSDRQETLFGDMAEECFGVCGV
jgi:hypothetical protein